ncbi:MAG: exonuclease SbcCD subunit D [Bacteroidales bacterium]
MKLLHTADWHLGQTFFEYDRKAEHTIFLCWLKELVYNEKIDLLLIAGDIFDTPNPSAESQKIYYGFLKEITCENPNLQIIIVAGNHDSAARLEAPNPLLEEMNITVRGVVKLTDSGEIDFNYLIIPLIKGGYCMAVPYLRQGDYPPALTYAQGVQKMYEELYKNIINSKEQLGPIIAMGHLQATGSKISENDRSERTVIGGLECISPNSFAQEIVYTALGHLHRGQRVSQRENLRYAGSPLPMSFAEKNNKQGVVIVEIGEVSKNLYQATNINLVKFDSPAKLLSIPQKPLHLNEVLYEIEKLPNGDVTEYSPYLEVNVLITEPEPALRHRIEEALKTKAVRLARIAATIPKSKAEENVITYEQLQTINPMDMANDIFRRRYGGQEMPEKMKDLLQSVIGGIER